MSEQSEGGATAGDAAEAACLATEQEFRAAQAAYEAAERKFQRAKTTRDAAYAAYSDALDAWLAGQRTSHHVRLTDLPERGRRLTHQ